MAIKFTKWNYKGFDEIRKSDGVTALCQQVAEERFSSVSGIKGYELEKRSYPDRNGFAIIAKEYPAIADNLKNNTLVTLV